MYNVIRKHTYQYAFRGVLVFIFAILVIEYNYSIFRSSKYLIKINGYNFATEVPAVNFNRTLERDADSNSSSFFVPPPPPPPPVGYLVWNDHCRMPDVNPFTADAMDIFERKNYTFCSDELPLTKVLFDINSRSYSLQIDENAKRKLIHDDDDISCCYRTVLRSGTGQRVDKDFKLMNCVPFYDNYVLPSDIDSVVVYCQSVKLKKQIQKDAHFFVRDKPMVQERLKSFDRRNDQERPVSVLMWGIDTMSRFNLRRAMPETTARLLNDGWFELSGYNKIDDNTLPNLMAILSGYSLKTAYSKCELSEPGGLDNCNLIWDLFRSNGYVTGYAEDETWMSTFDYVVKGFIKVPVDYYHRPFMLAIEDNLEIKKQSGLAFCVGLRHSAEYIYDFAIEFASRFRGEPYFGLFWTNTFTHNSFSDASAMDTRIASYIEEMKERGILDDSIVILFSDHGARFGPLRDLKQGYLEERLPFIFIWLPPWFQAKHPDFVQALKINRYRLTNPYDIHMTLKHILELSGRTAKLPQAEDCPNCQSVFLPVPEQRTCKDIAIDEHWCTCIPYENVPNGNLEIRNGVNFVLIHLNIYLLNAKLSPPCIPLRLKSIDEAQIKVNLNSEKDSANNTDTDIYRIRFTVQSALQGKFEATLAYSKPSKTYKIIDSVSRLDSYKEKSTCISDKNAKKYCICDKAVMKSLLPKIPLK